MPEVMDMNTDRFLKAEEVAAMLGLSYNSILKHLKSGKLPGRRVGRVWRVSEADLRRFIAGVNAPTEAPR